MSDELTPQTPPKNTKQSAQHTDTQTSPHTSGSAAQQPNPQKKKGNAILRVLAWALVVVFFIVLGLVISAYIAGFSSMIEMIDWIIVEIQATL